MWQKRKMKNKHQVVLCKYCINLVDTSDLYMEVCTGGFNFIPFYIIALKVIIYSKLLQ